MKLKNINNCVATGFRPQSICKMELKKSVSPHGSVTRGNICNLGFPNTPMNRGACEQIYSRAYMAVCASVCVCVCGVWTAIEGTA